MLRLSVRITLSAVFAAIICFSAFQLWEIESAYRNEAYIHEWLMEFKPEPLAPYADIAPVAENNAVSPRDGFYDSAAQEPPILNQSIVDLRLVNSDVIGWITIGGTHIDYPFVRCPDNEFYLRRDINKNPATAGTVFMDYRCCPSFSSPNTILYGHNMDNGSIFHDITKFGDKDFFDTHSTGVIYLENANYTLEIFAYLIVEAIDWLSLGDTNAEFLNYIESHSKHWRDAQISSDDRIVTLSTCSNEFNNARAAIVAKISAKP